MSALLHSAEGNLNTQQIKPLSLRRRLGNCIAASGKLLEVAIFPPECLVCNEPLEDGGRLCVGCQSALISDGNCCQRCAMPLPDVLPSHDCVRCRGKRWAFEKVLTLGPYQDKLREVVVAIKKPSSEPLRQAVAELLAPQVVASLPEPSDSRPLIVPVPNHWSHSIGYAADTAGLLAAALSHFTGIPIFRGAIRRTRKTRKQGMLPWSDRRKNVAGAFKILRTKPLTGRHIFLVDDVLTSGATVAEVAKLLRRGGAARVDVAVVARGTGTKSL